MKYMDIIILAARNNVELKPILSTKTCFVCNYPEDYNMAAHTNRTLVIEICKTCYGSV